MEVDEAPLLALLLKRKHNKNKKKHKRLQWVHPIVGDRFEKGNFHTLFPDTNLNFLTIFACRVNQTLP